MKRTNTIFAMAALLVAGVGTTVSCGKDDVQPAEGKTYYMTVTASKGGEGAKALTIDGNTISATWAAGEEVAVYNVTRSAELEGTLTAQSDGASTTLAGSLTGTIAEGDVLRLKFCSPDYSMQQGTLAYIAANCDYAEATVTVASVEGGEITAEAEAAFENRQAIVKFTLMDAGGTAINASVLSVTVNDIVYATIPASATSELYVALPGISEQRVTLSAKAGGLWYNKTQASVTFVDGQYYTVAARLAQRGMLPGTFSVSGSKKVHFSQGNLKYDNGTWSFHTNQYDYMGGTSHDVSESGSTDLFGWVGASSTWTGVKQYGVATEGSSSVNKTDGYGNVTTESLKADWGTLAISNGGNAENSGWQTLTSGANNSAEWYYLYNGRTDATAKHGAATVNGKCGSVVLPDNWTLPTGCTFTAGYSDWTRNVYTAEQWAVMDAAGAVFLPAAGSRLGTRVDNAGGLGRYSSSSAFGTDLARYVRFDGQKLKAGDADHRCYGQSVRLVCE